MTQTEEAMATANLMWQTVLNRQPGSDFFYGVSSTRIFCRPQCPSRRPNRENVVFFSTTAEALACGYRPCRRCTPEDARPPADATPVIADLCKYIELNFDSDIRLGTLAARAGFSPFHLQRLFRAATGLSPREYAQACKVRALKKGLREGHSVTRAIYDAGFGSGSRVYEQSDSRIGMPPGAYRKGGQGVAIRFGTMVTSLGPALVAGTDKGVCAIRFGGDPAALERELRSEFPNAEIESNAAAVLPWLQALADYVAGVRPAIDLPLDIRATAFQFRVWEHLRKIPRGTTASYSDVAAAIGEPKATRAVARAVASNPVAVTIPCHRVVRQDGGIGGYRWGVDRKAALLRAEGAPVAPRTEPA